MYLATEYGTMAFGLFLNRGSVPSFRCTELLTQEPGVETPIDFRKDERRPDPVWAGTPGWLRGSYRPPELRGSELQSADKCCGAVAPGFLQAPQHRSSRRLVQEPVPQKGVGRNP